MTVCPSVSICLSVIHIALWLYLPLGESVELSVCLGLCLPGCQTVSQAACFPVCVSVYPSNCLFVCPLHLSFYLSVSLTTCLCFFLYVSLSFFQCLFIPLTVGLPTVFSVWLHAFCLYICESPHFLDCCFINLMHTSYFWTTVVLHNSLPRLA